MLTCCSVNAQNIDSAKYKTEEINVISNKIVTNKFNSPVKVQFIDRKDIENKNGETLADVLQLGNGVFIKSYGGNYSLNTISLNGLGAEHTLVLLNGFKMNSSQNNQIDLNTVSKDNIESIEILNNGSSSIYGSEAMGGVVNIITKNKFTNIQGNDVKLKLNGQIGSYDQRRIYFEIDKSLNNFNLNFSLSKESSLNNYQYYFNNGNSKLLKERENSNYDNSEYSVNANYQAGKSSLINIYSNYSDQSRNIPGIETGSAPAENVQTDKNWNSILSYENILSKYLSLKSQLNYQNNLTNYYDKFITNSYYKNIYLSNLSQINYLRDNLEIAGGYEINYASLSSNEVEDNAYRIQPGIFLVSKINANEVFKIYPSIRYDFISDINKNVVSGMLGINIKPFSNSNFNIKASAGNNFAAPTFNELYWKDLGNTSLNPETSLNVDAGMIYGFNLVSENSIEVTYSYVDATDKIVWSPESNGLWTPKNIGKSESNVILIDANFNKELYNDFNANINFNYSNTQSLNKSGGVENNPAYGKQIFYIPQELAKCNVTFKYKDTGINIFYTFTGKRYTNFENTEYLQPVDMFEGNVFQNISYSKIRAQIKFEVNNLFDYDYQILPGYPMPLRNFKLGLSLEY